MTLPKESKPITRLVAILVVLNASLVTSVIHAQSAPSVAILRTVARYAPFITADELIPTGSFDQYIYSGSDISLYGFEWDVSAFFNTSDGGLDHMAYWKILEPDPDDSYLSLLGTLETHYHYNIVTAPADFKDVLIEVVAPGDSPIRRMILMGMCNIVDVRFMVSGRSETELVKLVGRDDHSNCWIAKFPISSLPTNLKSEYTRAITSTSKIK